MPQKVTLTGKFLDPSGNPLTGYITVNPLPEMVVDPEENNVYSGPVTVQLNEAGEITIPLIVTEAWSYQITYSLYNSAGAKIPMTSQIVKITEDTDIADLLETAISGNVTRPVLTYSNYRPGEITVSGVTFDPNDPGAILATVASAVA